MKQEERSKEERCRLRSVDLILRLPVGEGIVTTAVLRRRGGSRHRPAGQQHGCPSVRSPNHPWKCNRTGDHVQRTRPALAPVDGKTAGSSCEQ